MSPGAFPATALPPAGLTQGPGLADLRRALSLRELERADALWTTLLRALKPLGEAGRAQVAECLEAQAHLKEALDLGLEAQALRHRARLLRAGAPLGQRSGGRVVATARASGWDNHAWVRLQGDGDGHSPEVLGRVRAQLDREERLGRRWRIFWTLAVGGLAGLWCAAFTNLSLGILVPLGAAAAWLVAHRRVG